MSSLHAVAKASMLLILSLYFTLALTPLAAATIPAIIVFGDSSVDAGNNNHIPTIARSNFQPYGRDFSGGEATGRFCNGRIATDFISEALGLRPLVPAYLDPAYNITDFAVGVTFASAGTGYDNTTSNVLGVIPLWKELDYFREYIGKLRAYLGDWKTMETITKAVYIISIGTNDFLENYYAFPRTGRGLQYTVEAYQDFLIAIARNFIVDLHSLGARKISLGGLPPMGCMPLERAQNFPTRGCVETYNTVALSFNTKLSDMVTQLNQETPGLRLVLSNLYDTILNLVRTPSLYGFEVSDRACCATGSFEMGYACNAQNLLTCSDATKYVFWDAFHPTEHTNRIVADALVNTVLHQFI